MHPYFLYQIIHEHQAEMRHEAENFRIRRKTKMDNPLVVNRILPISATLAIIIVALVRFLG